MTLLADGLAQGMLQVPRIDNGMIHSAYLWVPSAGLHMQLTRSMTSFTSNCITLKDWRYIVIVCLGVVLGAVRVTKKTAVRNGPAEMSIAHVVTGGEVPFAFEREPGNGGLEKKAILIQKIRSAALTRSQGKLDLGFLLPKLSTGRIRGRFLVNDSLSNSLDFIS